MIGRSWARAGPHHTDGLVCAGERHRLDEVDADSGQVRHLGRMIGFRGCCRDQPVTLVGVALRADDSAEQDMRQKRAVRLRDLLQEGDAALLVIGKGMRVETQQFGPVRTCPIIQPAQKHAHLVLHGNVQHRAVEDGQPGNSSGVVEQRKQREVRQVETMTVHQLGLLAAFRQIAQSWSQHCSSHQCPHPSCQPALFPHSTCRMQQLRRRAPSPRRPTAR